MNIPSLAVINPTESIFVTSSYVSVPAIETLPSNCASPTNVERPVAFIFLTVMSGVPINPCALTAVVAVPVRVPVTTPSIGPTNLVAVMTPTR